MCDAVRDKVKLEREIHINPSNPLKPTVAMRVQL